MSDTKYSGAASATAVMTLGGLLGAGIAMLARPSSNRAPMIGALLGTTVAPVALVLWYGHQEDAATSGQVQGAFSNPRFL